MFDKFMLGLFYAVGSSLVAIMATAIILLLNQFKVVKMNDFIEVTPMIFWQKINPTNAISSTVIKNYGNTKMLLRSDFKIDNNLIGRIEEYNFCDISQERIYPNVKQYFLLRS